MNEITGSILELTDKKALIMTESCDFISIARQPQMFVGQQVKMTKSDIAKTKKSYIKYALLAASVFVLALFSVFYFKFLVSSTVYAYIDVDINPSIEFSIDKNAKVLDSKPLNSDAETLLKDTDLEDLPIKDAINQVVKTSEKMGFISANKENAILISAAVDESEKEAVNNSEAKAFNEIISSISNISFNLGFETIKPEVLKVTPEGRKAAIKNNISMGRYALYSELKTGNNDITVDKAKTTRVSDMIKISENLKKHKDKTGNLNSGNNDNKHTKSDNSNYIGNSSKFMESDNDDSVITDNKNTLSENSEKALPKQSKSTNSKNNESDRIRNSNSNKKSTINTKDANDEEYRNGKNNNKLELPNASDKKKDRIEDSYNNEKADNSGDIEKQEDPKTTPYVNPDNEKNTNNSSGNDVKHSEDGSSSKKSENDNNYKNNAEQSSDKPSSNESKDSTFTDSESQENHGNSQNENKSDIKTGHEKK